MRLVNVFRKSESFISTKIKGFPVSAVTETKPETGKIRSQPDLYAKWEHLDMKRHSSGFQIDLV